MVARAESVRQLSVAFGDGPWELSADVRTVAAVPSQRRRLVSRQRPKRLQPRLTILVADAGVGVHVVPTIATPQFRISRPQNARVDNANEELVGVMAKQPRRNVRHEADRFHGHQPVGGKPIVLRDRRGAERAKSQSTESNQGGHELHGSILASERLCPKRFQSGPTGPTI